MDTLYELLGALPHDNADGLRTAFRKAVKSAHPDLRPGDPDAGVKFRQIVRANEILGDSEQRAVYDHLLMLAHVEKDPASAHPIAARIHRVASGVMAIAIASIVTVGGYLLFMHMSMALVAPANNSDGTARAPSQLAAASPNTSPSAGEKAGSIAKPDPAGETIVAHVTPVIRVESLPPINVGVAATTATDPAANETGLFRARGTSAYRNGDLNGAAVDLDQAILLDPKSSASDIDRNLVFDRMRKNDRAVSDIARAKRVEKDRTSRSAPGAQRKLHVEQAAVAPAPKPKPKPQPATPSSRPIVSSYNPSSADFPSATFQ
jgi:curved DNA-binding protein CbpA